MESEARGELEDLVIWQADRFPEPPKPSTPVPPANAPDHHQEHSNETQQIK